METLNTHTDAQSNLPEGAKARLDQGNLTGDIAFSPDSTQLAVACDIGVWVYDVDLGLGLNLLVEHKEYVRCVAFSPDGTAIVSGSIDNTVVLWDAISGAPTATLVGHTDAVRSVAYSADGATVASGSPDGTVRLWDASTGEAKDVLEGRAGSIRCVAYSPDGRTLAAGTGDDTIILWDAATGKHRATLKRDIRISSIQSPIRLMEKPSSVEVLTARFGCGARTKED